MEYDGSVSSNGNRPGEIRLPPVEGADRDDVACALPEEAESYGNWLGDGQPYRFHYPLLAFAVLRLTGAVINHHLKGFFAVRSKAAKRRVGRHHRNAETA